MSIRKLGSLIVCLPLAVLAISLAGCGSSNSGSSGGTKLTGTVKCDGSSTVFPISEAVAEEFRKEQPDVQITVGTSGTGGGFKKFCAGEIAVQDASRPITPEEAELCQKNGIEFIELPIAYDGLAIVVNSENSWASDITVDELKKLWEPGAQQKVTHWNQIRASWPAKEIVLFGPGTDSGTFDYFTEAICGKKGASRGDYTASEDDNVLVEGVSRDPGSLGYFGCAYYNENKSKLKALAVDGGKGAINVSKETVQSGQYSPLSRPLFLYVNVKELDRSEVKAFMEFYLAHAGKLSEEVGYIALPEAAYTLAKTRLEKKTTGTIFKEGETQVGIKIEDLLKKETGQ